MSIALDTFLQHVHNTVLNLPDNSRVIRQVSLGMYTLHRDPLATNSTIALQRPARFKNVKKLRDFSYKK